MQIISVPAVFTCKTPSAGWVNLAQIRQVIDDQEERLIVVSWLNGDTQLFYGENAEAILGSLNESEQRCSDSNHRLKNRRTL